MRILLLTLAVAGICGVAIAQERTVVVPRGNKPFSVQKHVMVRIPVKSISGSRIEIKVDGAAKLDATNNIRELVNGMPVIGNTVKEFVLRPIEKGQVIVTITITPPQPTAKAEVRKIQFEVK